MAETKQALEQFIEQLAREIANNIPEATGETRGRIRTEVTDKSGKIFAPGYIVALETGRGPSRRGGSGGGQSLQQSILKWINAKGIDAVPNRKGKVITREQLSWAIAIKIHNEGTKLFRQGGKSGVISNVITESRIDAFAKTMNDTLVKFTYDLILGK